jgi:hypothetical protein
MKRLEVKIMKPTEKEIAECVGLWLAEGDSKTNNEITFTNNCLELIIYFHNMIKNLYHGNNKPRLYVYSSTKKILISEINGLKINNYTDFRAKKTYYIFRLSDVNFVKEWKQLVKTFKDNSVYYPEILRGIFAGEGNVKHDLKNKNSRNLRIASGKRDQFIEKLLKCFNIPIKFEANKRTYWIFGRNLEKLNAINIASLHPEKEAKFRKMINSIKEIHYSPGELSELLLNKLDKFFTTKELSTTFKRSEARIQETLSELKRLDKISYIRTRRLTLWANKELINKYLFDEKVKLLHNIKKYQSFQRVGKELNLPRKAVAKKVRQFEKENLIFLGKNGWEMTPKGKITVGVDEAGSKLQKI